MSIHKEREELEYSFPENIRARKLLLLSLGQNINFPADFIATHLDSSIEILHRPIKLNFHLGERRLL